MLNSYNNLSNTEVHSIETSSIPLADFWHPRNRDNIKQYLEILDLNIDIENATKCFEYPVFATKDGKEIGKPSRTDLMIIDNKYNIAIEAKYTEPLYESIEKWKNDSGSYSTKPLVLQSWYEYIKPYTNFYDEDIDFLEKEVVYQFLHRTASACYGCNNTGKIPVVIYQLFYDINDEKNKKHQFDVASQINDFGIKKLKFNNKLIFRIIMTPLLNVAEVKKKYQHINSDIFFKLKEKQIYEFGDSHIFMEYTREEIIRKISEYFLKNDLVNLYKDKCINYQGITKDTKEPYIKVIAEYLTEHFDDFQKGFENTQISREKTSYKTNGHTGISDFNFNKRKKGERREEKIAHAMFCQYKDQSCCFGNILDYQIPLKNSKDDKGIGKIDLLSYSERDGNVYLLELKKDQSNETLLRCILEAYTYSKIVNKEKLFNDFGINANSKLIISPLVYKTDECAKQSELLEPLLKKLNTDLKCFIWEYSSGEYKINLMK